MVFFTATGLIYFFWKRATGLKKMEVGGFVFEDFRIPLVNGQSTLNTLEAVSYILATLRQ